MLSGRSRAFALLGALMVAFTIVSTDFAEARRGGSFGSRGSRTFQQAPATPTAPNAARPVERSMSPTTAPNAATRKQTGATQQRPGLFGGLGGSLMRGMLIGGLLGMLLGYGFGGMAGMLGFLVQLLLVGLVVMLALRFFRSRSTPATAGGPGFRQHEPGSGSANIFGRNAHAREQADGRSASRPGHTSGRAGSFAIPGFGGLTFPEIPDNLGMCVCAVRVVSCCVVLGDTYVLMLKPHTHNRERRPMSVHGAQFDHHGKERR